MGGCLSHVGTEGNATNLNCLTSSADFLATLVVSLVAAYCPRTRGETTMGGSTSRRVTDYASWFHDVTAIEAHPWQARLGIEDACSDRLIHVPTGFGKTAGTVLPWLYHVAVSRNGQWPTRLVYVLPMRGLVEQTASAIQGWLQSAGLSIGIHVLMDGEDAGDWHLHPERPAILLGTQDMVLSRALNRGFGAARARWPIDFGLVLRDALWVLDEVQLMDVGLVTSAQLAVFSRPALPSSSKNGAHTDRPLHWWWMSATLQSSWLSTADSSDLVERLRPRTISVPEAERSGPLWRVRKEIQCRLDVSEPKELAQLAVEQHEAGTLTLVVVNRVDRATVVFDGIQKLPNFVGRRSQPAPDAPEVRLVHSRFRGADRDGWDFLRRGAPIPPSGRIVVATQVVEAGVDISARSLVTDLAPWSSLVQRFGRCARYASDSGRITVVGKPVEEGDAAPYEAQQLESAATALDGLLKQSDHGADPARLLRFEAGLPPEVLADLYRFEVFHVLRRCDIDDLFDTSPDLSGADIDVSRYIRSGTERDVALFWRSIGDDVAWISVEDLVPPSRGELCRVPIEIARKWLDGRRGAWTLDYLDGRWVKLYERSRLRRLVPGTTVLIDANEGGYDETRGFVETSRRPVAVVAPSTSEDVLHASEMTAAADDLDLLSAFPWKTIAVHGRETGAIADSIAETLGLSGPLRGILELAGRWHDVGKAHSTFQAAILEGARAQAGGVALGRDLAKAPVGAWRRPAYPQRPGFRHELASALALFELLRRVAPEHPALLGNCAAVMTLAGMTPMPVAPDLRIAVDHPIAVEIAALGVEQFNLLAWLVCTHHGKVRCRWASTPKDQDAEHGGIHGVCEGDALPEFMLADASKREAAVPALALSLAPAALGLGDRYGSSWAERVESLLACFGPFELAYLEALLRAADVRASMGAIERVTT